MKVCILGGYGVFGSLLAELLVRDGHDVAVAGRNLDKAKTLATRLGAHAIRVDLAGDLAPAFADAPDVVIDAAGPYQSYGADPYRVPRHCIERGCHYIDLSDAADFTLGIGSLDPAARQAGCWALSGASSVPGVSSAVLATLTEGLRDIRLIDMAILPGNRAPRGMSVIASILSAVGRPSQVWRGGVWRQTRGWTDGRRFTLAPGLRRSGYFVDVPDIRLFPKLFGARSVMFRAGLELGVMNLSLRVLAWLRGRRDFNLPHPVLTAVRWMADLLRPFGTDRGGMQVAVVSMGADGPRKATWTLIAEAGHGPYVPCIIARTLLRHASRIAPGARACLAEVTLAEIEDAMSDLEITTETVKTPCPTLFQTALGDRWASLPPPIRDLHSVQDVESFSGLADVTRGSSRATRLIALLVGFPRSGQDVPLTVTKTRRETGELWERNFGGWVFRSHHLPAAHAQRYRERFGPLTFELDLRVEDASLRVTVRRGWFCGLPLPRAVLPISDAREYVDAARFHFDIALSAPFGCGLIVRYRGWLTPDAQNPARSADSTPDDRI